MKRRTATRKRPAKRQSRASGEAMFLKKINDHPPTRKQMAAYVRACSNLPRGEEDYFVLHAIAWAKLFPNEHDQGFSAQFRLQALAHMAEEKPLPGWSDPDPSSPEMRLTREALFAAASVEPVTVRDGDVTFDREGLLKRAFQMAKAGE